MVNALISLLSAMVGASLVISWRIWRDQRQWRADRKREGERWAAVEAELAQFGLDYPGITPWLNREGDIRVRNAKVICQKCGRVIAIPAGAIEPLKLQSTCSNCRDWAIPIESRKP